MDKQLTKEWSDYDPKEGYQKKMQDVMLKNGDIITKCWPNAGFWATLESSPTNDKYKEEVSTSFT